jgi:hypothetical protein
MANVIHNDYRVDNSSNQSDNRVDNSSNKKSLEYNSKHKGNKGDSDGKGGCKAALTTAASAACCVVM